MQTAKMKYVFGYLVLISKLLARTEVGYLPGNSYQAGRYRSRKSEVKRSIRRTRVRRTPRIRNDTRVAFLARETAPRRTFVGNMSSRT